MDRLGISANQINQRMNQYPVEPSQPGGILITLNDLQKIVHGLEELTIGLRSRLSPVLRDDSQVRPDPNSTAPEPPRAPLDHQLRLISDQLQQVSANVDYILQHLEV